MSRPFFYRITAADFLAAVVTVPEQERAAWVLSLALDMVSGDSDTAKSQFAKDIIAEAGEFKQKKAEAGRKGGIAKASSAKAVLSDAVAKPSAPLASSSTVAVTEAVQKDKKIYGVCENVKLTDVEHGKLGDKLNGSRERYIDKLSTYDKMDKYKDHYRVILGWYTRDQEENKDDTNAPRGKRL